MPTEKSRMIKFDNVTKRYDRGREALSGVSLEVETGELVFLTGRSGAGKSTLLKLIGLLERPTRGQVLVDGRNIGRLPARQIPRHRRQIGMVFQDHKLLEDRTVFENIALPMIIAGYSQRDIRVRVHAALEHVGLLNRQKNTPGQLSTGEQQRIGIARAVVARPKLLIADEPTGNLDPELSLDIMNLFQRFNQVGVTMLIATHDLALLKQLGGRCIVLEDGKIEAADKPELQYAGL
jgi:cell division transport system ATP-binding protein